MYCLVLKFWSIFLCCSKESEFLHACGNPFCQRTSFCVVFTGVHLVFKKNKAKINCRVSKIRHKMVVHSAIPFILFRLPTTGNCFSDVNSKVSTPTALSTCGYSKKK